MESATAYAKVIYFGEEKQTIPIVFGKETLFRFSKPVKTISNTSRFIITPADKKQPDYKLLAVKPRKKSGTNNVSFILSDGSTVRTRLKTVSTNIPESTSDLYQFKPQDFQINSKEQETVAGHFSELDLLKAMIRGDLVSGYRMRKLKKSIYTGLKGVYAVLIRVYTGNRFNGYVFILENVAKKGKYHIDVRRLRLGNPDMAVLSQIDNSTIYPKKKGKNFTYLRIVAKSTSIYNDIVLPVAYVKGGGGK